MTTIQSKNVEYTCNYTQLVVDSTQYSQYRKRSTSILYLYIIKRGANKLLVSIFHVNPFREIYSAINVR